MRVEYRHHIDEIRAAFGHLKAGPRLIGGARLWQQFEDAVLAVARSGDSQAGALYERVNEIVLAQLLLDDTTLAGPIRYEPEIVRGGKRFDFVGTDTSAKPVYIELKTVHPRTDDTDANWQKAVTRMEHVAPGTQVIVGKGWLGATIAGNMIAARTKFLGYTIETEAKLAAHDAVEPGRGILVFAGSGFHWNRSELEDFCDFYATGTHRADDPWADMEAHDMQAKGTILVRNLEGFALLTRDNLSAAPGKLIYPVGGPR